MMSNGLEGFKDVLLKAIWSTGVMSVDDIEYETSKYCSKSSIQLLDESTTLMFHDNIGNGNFMVKFELMSEKEEFQSLFAQFCRYAKAHRHTVAGQPDMSRYVLGIGIFNL
jgi:hypothetical protein